MSNLPQPVVPLAAPAASPVLELSYVSLAGDQIIPATRENVHLLQHAADYQVCARNLRVSGIGDIVWGLICCGLGMMLFRVNMINAAIVGLGAVLIGLGIWLIARPSPLGMLFDGGILLLVAAWNLWVNYLAITGSRGATVGFGPVIAVAQVFWGVHRLRSYPRFKMAVAMQPSEANVRWLRTLVQSTVKAKTKHDADVISFRRRGLFVNERWKARLLPEVGVFVMSVGNFSFGARRDALLAARDEVAVVRDKKKMLSRYHKLMLRVGARGLNVTMHEESLGRLRAWITPIAPTRLAPLPPLPSPSET